MSGAAELSRLSASGADGWWSGDGHFLWLWVRAVAATGGRARVTSPRLPQHPGRSLITSDQHPSNASPSGRVSDHIWPASDQYLTIREGFCPCPLFTVLPLCIYLLSLACDTLYWRWSENSPFIVDWPDLVQYNTIQFLITSGNPSKAYTAPTLHFKVHTWRTITAYLDDMCTYLHSKLS